MHAREPAPANPAFTDPEFGELTAYFRAELPARVRSLEQSAAQGNAAEIRRIAHQLKGAAPGFGFDDVGQAAARVEDAFRTHAQASLAPARARADLNTLIALCRSHFPHNAQRL